ncbi:hypothetical protein GXW82_06000 [Streptacidiphilus sp. 4-A2]|nr:hypothetical protein [Streptacidiphilus sp. 4-A2]
MQFEAEHLTDAFHAVLTEPLPADSNDLAGLLTEARRRRSRRRTRRAVAVAAAACVVGAAVPAVLLGRSPQQAQPAAPATPSCQSDALMFDMSVRWLPAALAYVQYSQPTIGDGLATLMATPIAPESGGLYAEVSAEGRSRPSWPGLHEAGPINGHMAYSASWKPGPASTIAGNVVVFESANGQWAEVETDYPTLDEALKIARNTVFTAPTPVSLPIQWTGPKSAQVTDSALTTSAGKLYEGQVTIQINNNDSITIAAVPADAPLPTTPKWTCRPPGSSTG